MHIRKSQKNQEEVHIVSQFLFPKEKVIALQWLNRDGE